MKIWRAIFSKTSKYQVINVDQANNRLVLSARELLKEKERKAKEAQIASIPVDTVLSGTVETLQTYGAFIKLENGLSGLVHVSQISQKHVKSPSAVLHIGDEVQVKVIGIKDGKISLSMKALEEPEEEVIEKVEIPKAEEIGTNLGDLSKTFSYNFSHKLQKDHSLQGISFPGTNGLFLHILLLISPAAIGRPVLKNGT